LRAEELAQVLADHTAWLEVKWQGRHDSENPHKRANLCGADLTSAQLRDVNLIGADLSEAKLFRADLRGAVLRQANLTRAEFRGADLRGADLDRATLTDTSLLLVNLSHSALPRADLRGANLSGADLTGAWLEFADLSRVTFELRPNALPDIALLTTAKGLSQMSFYWSPHSLVALREALKQAGLREREREVTFALRHTQRRHTFTLPWEAELPRPPAQITWRDKVEAAFNYIFFEQTCEYGLSPGRPLRLLGYFIVLFAIPYWAVIGRSSVQGSNERAGIWAVWSPERVHKSEGPEAPVRVTREFSFSMLNRRCWGRFVRWSRGLPTALYFSALSAFHIGWRELNVGNWIARLQRDEYVLRGVGWVRTVAGVQALLSVYLLALWVLTYFGRPFE
jgi:hypothetical protein